MALHLHGNHGHPSSELTDHHYDGNDEEKKWLELEHLYQNKSTEAKSMIEWFTQNIDNYLISADAITRDKFSVVSFGCGDGRKDRAALRAIGSSLRSKLFYCGVDPDEKAIERFRKSVDECADGILHDVNFDLVVQTYESYVEAKLEERTCQSKTDLLLFVDSLCHLTLDPEEVLVDCYEHELSPQGVIVISLWNSDDFWFKIREQFSDGQIPDEGNDYLTVQDVKKVAEKHNWRFEMYSPNYSLDVSECFIADSEQGEMMMECLTCYSNVQSTAANDARRGKLLEFLQREAVLNESSRVLNGNHGILVIHK